MSSRIRTTRFIHIPVLMVAALSLVGAIGCGSDNKQTNPNPNPGSGSTSYTGNVTGTGANGSLSITIQTSTPAPQNGTNRARGVVSASGTFTPAGGSAIALTGNYDDQSDVVAIAGSGWNFGGGLTTYGMEGACAGPGGETGFFTVFTGSTGITVIVGRFVSDDISGHPAGDFNISIKGTEIHGSAVEDGTASPIPLDGTYVIATGAITIVNPSNPTGQPLATGTLNTGTGQASGDYENGSDTGTWSGTVQTQPNP